jgi:hypothetical protein
MRPGARIPVDARYEAVMDILGDHCRAPGYPFLTLVILNEKMLRFERGPGEGRIEFSEGRRRLEKNEYTYEK